MAKKSLLAMGVVFVITLASFSAWAVPQLINFQGKLTDSGGAAVSDGSYDMKFVIYDDVAPGGTLLWQENQSVAIEGGIYNVQLGYVASFPADLFDNDTLYLEVRVYNQATTSWETLEPRQQLSSTAFSMMAAKAEDAMTLDGKDSSEFSETGHDHTFGEITGTATDAQIPNNITINNAATADYAATADSADYADSAGDADTVDGEHASAFADTVHTHGFGQITGTATDAQIPDNITINHANNANFAIAADNADTLDGMDSGAFATTGHSHSATDITSGTLNTGRYSAYSDLSTEGYLGNASGDLAQNNGTRQVNLNADMLDGLQAEYFAWSGHGHHSLRAADGNPTQAVYVDDDGQVCIGQTDPGNKLHVVEYGASMKYPLKVDNPYYGLTDSGVGILFSTGGDDGLYAPNRGKGALVYEQTGTWNIGTFHFLQNDQVGWDNPDLNDSVMTIRNDGNVGIGTTNPTERLEVNGDALIGSSSKGIRLRSTGSLADLESLGTDLVVNNNGKNTLFNVSLGNVGIGTWTPSAKLEVGGDVVVTGNVTTAVLEITGGSDLSERFDISGYGEEFRPSPGMVVSIDSDNPGELVVSTAAYDKRVAGIISGAGGVKPGMLMGQKSSEADGRNPVALTGRVYCWADASGGAIRPGDLLTTSDSPGHAMKATDCAKAQGAILGKAMTGLESGKGLVLVLVTLQ